MFDSKKTNSLVIYKNKPALVIAIEDKISIKTIDDELVRVREKDILFLHDGPITSLKSLNSASVEESSIRDVWELLDGQNTTLSELSDLLFGSFTPQNAWCIYKMLVDKHYFSGTIENIIPESKSAIDAAIEKRNLKEKESAEKEAFLVRLKKRKLNLPDDKRFLQDVESLALGLSDKSKTLKAIGYTEDPVLAHRLLLECALWDNFVNPYILRNGCQVNENDTQIEIQNSDSLNRVDLTSLKSFAIDAIWSTDPDDAISAVSNDDGTYTLYVSVADPAKDIIPNCKTDLEARSRGATLYLPESTIKMLPGYALANYCLFTSEKREALTFKITLTEHAEIKKCEIMLSYINVSQITYQDADILLNDASNNTNEKLVIETLNRITNANIQRRKNSGGIFIDFPELHIVVKDRDVSIEKMDVYKSVEIVRECMLLAGEGAADWALANKVPFPYVSQEAELIPDDIRDGYSGAFQIRKCLRPRTLTAKPGIHFALGLSVYTQVTSPLRRYTDLLAHQQIHAFLSGTQLMEEDELLSRLVEAERGAAACNHAERSSRTHWLCVYLQNRTGEIFDAILLDIRGPHGIFLIPDLAIEAFTGLPYGMQLDYNDNVKLKLRSVDIPDGKINFVCEK
jgi:exoribonuclease-2